MTLLLFVCKLGWNQCENSNLSHPSVSIILFTNRPGGVDMAFYSLAQQESRDYELIVVDDSGGERKSSIVAFADSLNVNLQHIVRSKSKTSAVSARGGEANAMNTGLLLARGQAAVYLNDFTWLPRNFVSETAAVFPLPIPNFIAEHALDQRNIRRHPAQEPLIQAYLK